jgi:DNA polymerase III epsilon subunit-like protein
MLAATKKKQYSMQRIENFQGRSSLFIFDLEFIGDVRQLATCRIWEIAVYSVATGTWFQAVVDPDPSASVFPPPPIPELPQLTRDFLTARGARLWGDVYRQLQTWVQAVCPGGHIPVFISHNTFRADKPILEFECQRAGLKMPFHWYFFDSLHYSRYVIKQSSGNYSLTGLYMDLFGEKFDDAHRAEADVRACHRILQRLTLSTFNLTGPTYPSYSTSLRSVRWIGRRAEAVFAEAGVTSLEKLLMLIQEKLRQDFLCGAGDERLSVQKTLTTIIENKLPYENIENILNTLLGVLRDRPFSHAFVQKAQDVLVKC